METHILPRPQSVHLYVDDPDATYARTLQAAPTSFYARPTTILRATRWGAVKDSFGTHWYNFQPRVDGRCRRVCAPCSRPPARECA